MLWSRWSWSSLSGPNPVPQARCGRGNNARGQQDSWGRLRKNDRQATRTRTLSIIVRRAAGQPRWILRSTALPVSDGARAGSPSNLRARGRPDRRGDRADRRFRRHCTTLLARARDIHLAAVREVRPNRCGSPRSLRREMADEYGTFEGQSRFTPTRWVRPGSRISRLATMLGENSAYSGGRIQKEEQERASSSATSIS